MHPEIITEAVPLHASAAASSKRVVLDQRHLVPLSCQKGRAAASPNPGAYNHDFLSYFNHPTRATSFFYPYLINYTATTFVGMLYLRLTLKGLFYILRGNKMYCGVKRPDVDGG
jgi:hypothetical protein